MENKENIVELNKLLSNADLVEIKMNFSTDLVHYSNEEKIEFVSKFFIHNQKNKKRFLKLCKEEKINIFEYISSLLKLKKSNLTQNEIESKIHWACSQMDSQFTLLNKLKNKRLKLKDNFNNFIYNVEGLDLSLEFGEEEERIKNKKEIDLIRKEFNEISKSKSFKAIENKLKILIEKQEKLCTNLEKDFEKEIKPLEKEAKKRLKELTDQFERK